MEEIIQAKSGSYARMQVTVKPYIKVEILEWAKQLGINKAAFLRVALMIGASQLVKQILDHRGFELVEDELSGQPDART